MLIRGGVSVSDGRARTETRRTTEQVTGQWIQTKRELMELEVKVQHRNPEVATEGIMSPVKAVKKWWHVILVDSGWGDGECTSLLRRRKVVVPMNRFDFIQSVVEGSNMTEGTTTKNGRKCAGLSEASISSNL